MEAGVRPVHLAIALIALLASACSGAGSSPPPSPSTTPTPGELPATPTQIPTVEPPVTTMLLTGDLIPARCTYARIEALGGDYTLPFQPLHHLLSSADITVGTLDSTVSDAGVPYGCTETFSLAGPAAAVEGFRYAGFDVISQASNHAKDCGVSPCGNEAMMQTTANLQAAGIQTVGAGADVAEARRPAIVERNGVRFAFLSYDDIASYHHATASSPGTAPLYPELVAEDIAAARRVADVVVVLPQWGIEYTAAPTERQRALARVVADAGADLIVGNHPHWVQAHETIGDTFVAYALGNFLFDQDWSLETQQGALLEVEFRSDRITSTRFIPIRIHDQYQPRLAEPEESRQILDRIESASAALE